jgi:hypothetical protein
VAGNLVVDESDVKRRQAGAVECLAELRGLTALYAGVHSGALLWRRARGRALDGLKDWLPFGCELLRPCYVRIDRRGADARVSDGIAKVR